MGTSLEKNNFLKIGEEIIMRIKEQITDIDYGETKKFFTKRAEKYRENNPYSVTMYQDNHPELVKERNRVEVEKLCPKLCLSENSRVLDVACGIGRWADAMDMKIDEYCGIDFSGELIDIANKRNKKANFSFCEGAISEIDKVLLKNEKGKYNTVLMVGILMYLNDNDLLQTLQAVEKACEEHAIICIREPVGITERLTLKDFFSEELQDNYNAIYRTREELLEFFEKALLEKSFSIKEQGFLFDEDELNNRKETAQYYYFFER